MSDQNEQPAKDAAESAPGAPSTSVANAQPTSPPATSSVIWSVAGFVAGVAADDLAKDLVENNVAPDLHGPHAPFHDLSQAQMHLVEQPIEWGIAGALFLLMLKLGGPLTRDLRRRIDNQRLRR